MPTDETPSAGAVARAEEIMGWYPLSLQRPWSEDAPEYDEQWRLAVARELDRFAREREAAVLEEVANEYNVDEFVRAALRTRAAEARKTP